MGMSDDATVYCDIQMQVAEGREQRAIAVCKHVTKFESLGSRSSFPHATRTYWHLSSRFRL